MTDWWRVAISRPALATCGRPPGCDETADLDGDGCVTLVDYQAERMCYQMANGKEFVAPKPKPVAVPAKRAP